MELVRNNPTEREPSPDWLRSFQTPLKDFSTLSSSSPSASSHDVALGETQGLESVKKSSRVSTHDRLNGKLKQELDIVSVSDGTPSKPQRIGIDKGKTSNRKQQLKPGYSADVVDIDTDGEEYEEEEKVFSSRGKLDKKQLLERKGPKGNLRSTPLHTRIKKEEEEAMELPQPMQQNDYNLEKSKTTGGSKGARLQEDEDQIDTGKKTTASKDEELLQEDDPAEGQERRTKRVASTLPLVFADKIHRSKILLECEGDALDLSGDIGAVGRFSVSSAQGKVDEVLLDLKGVIYKTTIVPSNTFFVVNVGQSEAKVESLMNDFVQLQPSTNLCETETMVEGTLEGFEFDSDDYGERPPPMGLEISPRKGDLESEDGERPIKKRAKSDKTLKSSKLPLKKFSKAGASKVGRKSGLPKKAKYTGKSAKKSSISKKPKSSKNLRK